MERLDLIFKSAISIGGAAISYLYGGWSALLGVLVAVVVLDYITGMLAAGSEGKLSSSVGFKGISKKMFIFIMVAVAHLIDTSLGDAHLVRDATIFFYLANETLSIIENGGRLGVPIPNVLKQAVEVLKGKSEVNK